MSCKHGTVPMTTHPPGTGLEFMTVFLTLPLPLTIHQLPTFNSLNPGTLTSRIQFLAEETGQTSA